MYKYCASIKTLNPQRNANGQIVSFKQAVRASRRKLCSHRPQPGLVYKNTGGADTETWWTVPAQACES